MGSALADQGCDLENLPQKVRLLTYLVGLSGQLRGGGLISHFGRDYKAMFETWAEHLELRELLEDASTNCDHVSRSIQP